MKMFIVLSEVWRWDKTSSFYFLRHEKNEMYMTERWLLVHKLKDLPIMHNSLYIKIYCLYPKIKDSFYTFFFV